MIVDVLVAILCYIKKIGAMVLDAAIGGVNAVIAALADFANGVLGLLPDMPDLPLAPAAFGQVMGWVAWFLPVAYMVQLLTFLILALVSWQVLSIALRWAKAVRE